MKQVVEAARRKMKQVTQPKSKRHFRSVLIRYSLLTALCLSLGFIDAVRSYVTAYSDGIFHVDLDVTLRWDMSGWLFWVVFIPLVIRLSRRYPLNQRNWRRSVLLVFLPVGLLLALARTLFPALVSILFDDGLDAFVQWFPLKYYYLITDYLVALVFYALVLVFGQATNYYKRYREEELRTAQLESQLAQAQLQALKMQLHPHFLFNALHSISSHIRDTETARRMIARLGDFLRLTLANTGAQEVTLKQELEFMRCYLDIERTRFRDRLTVEMEIAPETWDARVPNLILQPLVENAIKHGLAPHRAPGRIDVRARRLNGSLQVQIQDNGRGLQDAPSVEALSETDNGAHTEGIGLSTTLARLEHLYPNAHKLQLRNAPEGGLIVTLEVPFKIEMDEASASEKIVEKSV